MPFLWASEIAKRFRCIRGAPGLTIALVLQDKTFAFERKRNRPVKYDRNLMATTIKVPLGTDNHCGLPAVCSDDCRSAHR